MFQAFRLSRQLSRLGETIFNVQKSQLKCILNSIALNTSERNHVWQCPRIAQYCSQTTASGDQQEVAGLREDVDVQELTGGDPELERKLRVIVLEVSVMLQEGQRVPELGFVRQQHWRELLAKGSRSQRKRYLEFLWKTERKKEGARARREQAREERAARPAYEGDGHLRYGLGHNTFLLRIYDSTINQLHNARLVSAARFGQPLLLDVGYDGSMTARECLNCGKQLMLAFAENRAHRDPFDLHLVNAARDAPSMRALHRHVATLHEPWFPLHVHARSHLEVFAEQRHRLVYLTPHCRTELRHFDHDAIYIVGGIVDRVAGEPLSLARAKREGLRMARLPLDRYLQWGGGSGKSLTINQVLSILLDVKDTGDWEFALRHVPRRKVARDPPAAPDTPTRYNNTNTNKTTSRRTGASATNSQNFIKELLNN